MIRSQAIVDNGPGMPLPSKTEGRLQQEIVSQRQCEGKGKFGTKIGNDQQKREESKVTNLRTLG